jgi:pimeloyl-ACP methyl ester carboxylesterase
VRFLHAAGQRLEYEWHGPPPAEAPTLVFLHEGLGCVSHWRDFPRRLAEATGWGAFVYSRAGYGGSDPVSLPRPLTFMQDEGRDVLPQVLDAAGVRQTVLFGHSDGASIALVHAGSTGGARVRGLVIEAPHVFCEEIGVRSIAAAGEAYRAGPLRARLQRHHGANVDCAFFGWHDTWLARGFRQWTIAAFLPHVSAPVLQIQGDDDEYGTGLQLDAVERGCAGPVRTLRLADCGHAPHRSQPERVLEAAAAFVRDLR